MPPEQTAVIKMSWRALEPIADQAASLCYQRLFELAIGRCSPER